ncbi:hypothetical protein D9611_003246 [Ephemerocybe angulata]|uniref:ferroxidase n=1 Tax=Ephemerocybe angulata TaxID=980116 RepID=A0A8H5FHY8_9AGAR|nr:hypothetical protein D9611_003246 [Tulosesus angulatus]
MRPSVTRLISRGARAALTAARVSSPQRYIRPTRPTCPFALQHTRWLSTPAPFINESHLTVDRYNELSDMTMDSMLESLETLLDDLGNPEYEVEYHSGVLTLHLGEHGTYVINKQPPNMQIWLSSPHSGPKRYDYSDDRDDWIYSRDDRSLGELLNEELSEALGEKVDLQLSNLSSKL